MKLCLTIKSFFVHWRSFVIILTPLLLLPLPLSGRKEAKCGYTVIIMAVYWMTEAVPLPVTALLPVLLFPSLGVLSTEDICKEYLQETNMMFIGGIIVAIAVEHCNLHKRIALKVLLLIGTSPKRLMLGFMLTTMFLSMWISNTASTAMMVPIASAVLNELKSHQHESKTINSSVTELTTTDHDTGTFDEETRRTSRIRTDESKRPTEEEICYFLGIAYAANIGGTGTMTGTGTNLTFKGQFEKIFGDVKEGLHFANWMAFNVPLMFLNCFLAWIWLQILFMGLFRCRGSYIPKRQGKAKAVRALIRKNYEELGPVTYHELNVFFIFLLVVVLWFFRKPEFIPGWANIYKDVVIDDASAGILAVFLLFVLPANLDFLRAGQNRNRKASPALLNWKIVHEKVPWGLVFLLGGGFAMAAASRESDLSAYLGQQLASLKVLPSTLILTIICVAATFLTEVSSNVAIASILLPVLANMSVAIRIHPLYLMLPATLSCSYAFMLPVATPSNAIVVAASNMRTLDMMKAGLGMNLICCASLIICFSTLGSLLYGLDEWPDFAEKYYKDHINDTAFNF